MTSNEAAVFKVTYYFDAYHFGNGHVPERIFNRPNDTVVVLKEMDIRLKDFDYMPSTRIAHLGARIGDYHKTTRDNLQEINVHKRLKGFKLLNLRTFKHFWLSYADMEILKHPLK